MLLPPTVLVQEPLELLRVRAWALGAIQTKPRLRAAVPHRRGRDLGARGAAEMLVMAMYQYRDRSHGWDGESAVEGGDGARDIQIGRE